MADPTMKSCWWHPKTVDLKKLFQGYRRGIYTGYGETVGAGWEALLTDLVAKVEARAPGFIAYTQIKEKFGGLRVYYDFIVPLPQCDARKDIQEGIYNLVCEAEHLSFKTCEFCAAPAGPRDRSVSWVLTLCPGCQEQRIEEQLGEKKKIDSPVVAAGVLV